MLLISHRSLRISLSSNGRSHPLEVKRPFPQFHSLKQKRRVNEQTILHYQETNLQDSRVTHYLDICPVVDMVFDSKVKPTRMVTYDHTSCSIYVLWVIALHLRRSSLCILSRQIIHQVRKTAKLTFNFPWTCLTPYRIPLLIELPLQSPYGCDVNPMPMLLSFSWVTR